MSLTTRCPYCHDGCAPGEPFVVCVACRAAHHGDCWDQDGRCASCRGERCLREDRRAADAERGLRLLAGVGAAPLVVATLGFMALMLIAFDDLGSFDRGLVVLSWLGAPALVFGLLAGILARFAWSGTEAALGMLTGAGASLARLGIGATSVLGIAWSLKYWAAEGPDDGGGPLVIWTFVALLVAVSTRLKARRVAPRRREEAVELAPAAALRKRRAALRVSLP